MSGKARASNASSAAKNGRPIFAANQVPPALWAKLHADRVAPLSGACRNAEFLEDRTRKLFRERKRCQRPFAD